MKMTDKFKPSDIFPRLPKGTAYSTSNGVMVQGRSEEVLAMKSFEKLKGRVNLIFTSPPFPLIAKKRYGNHVGDDYMNWFLQFGPIFKDLLAPDGSIVIEIGNSWERGSPTMSTIGLKTLLRFQEDNDLHLCQEIICNNTARLPGPAQWVTVERIRLKDSYTRLWWLSPSERPKANNKNVLRAYSKAMLKIFESKRTNSGIRPSAHRIGDESFVQNNGGSIPPSVLNMANTHSKDSYQNFCRDNNLEKHPARMQPELAEFFIKFLTSEGDIILDPFGGTNTTGYAAECLGRKWVSIEPNADYISGSLGRFDIEDLYIKY